MKVTLQAGSAAAEVDISDWCDIFGFDPTESDLGNPVDQFGIQMDEVDGVRVPIVPVRGQTARIYEDDGVTLLARGRLSEVEWIHPDWDRSWRLLCQTDGVRALEAVVQSADYSSATDNDRNMVIAIFRSALKLRTFGTSAGVTSDPIITANEPNWPGVQATAFLSGVKFDGKTVKASMDLLAQNVPNVWWDVGADDIVTYGLMRTLAATPLTSSPIAAPLMNGYKGYRERYITGDQRNMQKYIGAGGANATAFDEVAYSQMGNRILEATPITNAAASSGIVRQLAYANLKLGRKVVRLTAFAAGYKAGQVVDVVNERLTVEAQRAPYPDLFQPVYARTDTGRLAVGFRGRVLIQKVKRSPVAPASGVGPSRSEWSLECGDNVRDFQTALAVLAGLGQ